MWFKPPMITPDATLQAAARKMTEVNADVLPVGRDGKVKGVITDRDIVTRAVSEGISLTQAKVLDFMTSNIYSCKETDTIHAAADTMKKKKASRLAVMDDQNKFCGILSFGHIFRDDANAEEAADIITRVASRSQKEKKAAVV